MLTQNVHMVLAVARMTSPRGRCHTFDRGADGYARGEAVAALVLVQSNNGMVPMPGSAVRQDGRSASLTAPNGQAQADLIVVAHVRAGMVADVVALHEAHGTGTALGDPIEVGSLVSAVLARRSESAQAVHVGSFKANIGHAEASAGAAGLLKVMLEAATRASAPNAQLRVVNQHVDELMVESRGAALLGLGSASLPQSNGGGVSSFGYSGTIAHAVLLSMNACADLSTRPAYKRLLFAWRDIPHPFLQHLVATEAKADFRFRSFMSCWWPVVKDHLIAKTIHERCHSTLVPE
jgi:acyl transferase domain-containing protein